MHNPAAFSLEGKTAVVTGASRGIGAAIASGLQASGAKVFGLSRSGTAPSHVTAIKCDLADDAAIRSVFDHLAKTGERLDVLVNAAGISLPASATMSELQRFRDTLAVDLSGVYATILAAYPLLKKAGGGSIINVTSINSVRGFPGNPGYVAAKAGLAGLTRALAADYARDGIRVNALAPGYVATEMTATSFADPVDARGSPPPHHARPLGQPGRSGRRRGFSGVVRIGLCDRPGIVRRWRLDREGSRDQRG